MTEKCLESARLCFHHTSNLCEIIDFSENRKWFIKTQNYYFVNRTMCGVVLEVHRQRTILEKYFSPSGKL